MLQHIRDYWDGIRQQFSGKGTEIVQSDSVCTGNSDKNGREEVIYQSTEESSIFTLIHLENLQLLHADTRLILILESHTLFSFSTMERNFTLELP